MPAILLLVYLPGSHTPFMMVICDSVEYADDKIIIRNSKDEISVITDYSHTEEYVVTLEDIVGKFQEFIKRFD